MLLVVSLIVVPLLIWYYLIKPMSYWSDRGVKQTQPWIILGDAWKTFFRRYSLFEFLQFVYKLHPTARYVGMYSFRTPMLFIRDPELIKQLGIKDFDHFTDHAPNIDPDADPVWSKNLFALTGQRWKMLRNIMTPVFTSSKVKGLYELMVETAQDFVKHYDTKTEHIIEVDMKDASTRYTNDIIASTVFGVKVDSLQNEKNSFYEMGRRLTDFTGVLKGLLFLGGQMCPPLFKLFGVTLLDKVAAKYFTEIVEEAIKEREERRITRPDIINLLLETRKKSTIEISNADIASQAIIFFFGGFDTISTAMSFGAYELAVNKDVQDKLRTEIRKYSQKNNIDYETLQGMPYLDMVVSEILRKWPPFPFVDRCCTKPYTVEAVRADERSFEIKMNQEVWFPIIAIHRDPEYYPDPDRFDPERFSEENKSKLVPYTYMPFGIGPRLCIGNRFALLEIKALFFHLLLNYELVPTKKTPIPMELTKDFTMVPKGGYWLGLKRIET